METTVYKQLPARFDMCGKFIGYPLQETEEKISAGLIQRIYNWAARTVKESGFDFILAWEVTVSTSDRSMYQVEWKNPAGGSICVVGILIGKGGWPVVDHGFEIHR